MSDQKVTGSCQCGALSFEAEVDLDHTVTCNCSRCRRLGAVFAFTPKEKFRLISGEGQMTEYLFNSETISHRFCKTCGIEPFGFGAAPDGAETAAVNVNCLDGIDARALTSMAYDGASA
ncbi:GFA family protein [Pseudoroseicyclus tamaricis]|uniref:GFA family protein n=1 Tax=Pseudoroseicyclus tamaricis TaxID=2705421 RepID=A0A6B2JKA3_9RHOB|nr:GFA family protein [Pseudoroseicyclus tamaricis]NDV01893.1 GFA family protein [Pseudoroseicyclus tamaricis]